MPSKGSTTTRAHFAANFPFFHYASLLGTSTLLLSFTALVLPRSTLLLTPLPPQQSSLDKPQYPFLEPITASPVWTLIWLCVGTITCQAWWAGWMRQWWGTHPRGKSSNAGNSDSEAIARAGSGKLRALRDAWAHTLLASGLFHSIIVLFGAPITSHIPHTYLLSLLVSVLTVFVPSYTLSLSFLLSSDPSKDGADLQWIALFVERKLEAPMERALVFPVLGSFLGCWTGAFPIPLDWDRPWQAWPLTPAYGALAGYLLGSWLSLGVNVFLFFASEGRSSLQQGTTERPPMSSKKRSKKKRE